VWAFFSFFGRALAVASMLPALALAQPDAGTLRQQIEQGPPQPLPRKVIPLKPLEPEPLKAPAGLTVTVKAFRFAGNTLLSAEQIAPAVAAYLDRPVGLPELRKAAAAVAEAYRQAGWIVRVYLPQQEIEGGMVTIQVVEAVFGGAVLEGSPPLRLSSSVARGMIESAQAKGENLNADAIERALLLIDDLPGVTVAGNLRPGHNQGETELVFKLGDEPLLRAEAGIDNTGSRSTGAERLTANLALNSPLAQGDLMSANFLHTEGSHYLRAGYTLPLGSDGWRAGINGSALSYRLIAPEFLALNGKGTSDSVGLDASYPIIRSRLRNLFVLFNHDRKTFDNEANGATTSRYQLSSTSIGLSGNLFDNLGGGGANAASLVYTSGNLDLGGSPTQGVDAITTRAAGSYGKWRYSLSRQQVITNELSFYGLLSGQVAEKNLDSSEKFYLGGTTGVRAYPASEGGGSEGQMLNLELRRRLPKGFNLTAFYDWGEVRVNRDNNFVGAPTLNDYSIKGAGLALGWQADSGLTARLTWARRLGENPNPTATGRDQDGSLIRDRLWANVMLTF
jgi:hemolysin activation/secretion protein